MIPSRSPRPFAPPWTSEPEDRRAVGRAARSHVIGLVRPQTVDEQISSLYRRLVPQARATLTKLNEKEGHPLMLSSSDKTQILFRTIGSPPGTGDMTPSSDQLEAMTEYAFKSRSACSSWTSACERESSWGRRLATPPVTDSTTTGDRRGRCAAGEASLDEVAEGEWVLFKSIKPFAATPNDTDWFPFDPARHEELVRLPTGGRRVQVARGRSAADNADRVQR